MTQNAMRQPKPSTEPLTKDGKPRQRAPGAGRKARDIPRTKTMPRVSEGTHQQLLRIAAAIAKPGQTPCLADAIEHAAALAIKRMVK